MSPGSPLRIHELAALVRRGADFKTAALSIVAVATLGHPGSDQFTQQTLQGVADLGMIGRCGSQRAAMALDEIPAACLRDLGQPSQVVQYGTRAGHPLTQ